MLNVCFAFLLLMTTAIAGTKTDQPSSKPMPKSGMEQLQSDIKNVIMLSDVPSETQRIMVRILVNVTAEGNVKECRLMNSMPYDIDDKTFDLIETKIKSTSWNPGVKEGKNVDSYIVVPVEVRF